MSVSETQSPIGTQVLLIAIPLVVITSALSFFLWCLLRKKQRAVIGLIAQAEGCDKEFRPSSSQNVILNKQDDIQLEDFTLENTVSEKEFHSS